MISILIGSILISLLHALIPSHWLPIITIGRSQNWSTAEVQLVTFYSGMAHALSTVVIGLMLGMLGREMAERISMFTVVIAPVLLILLGIFFICFHHRHLVPKEVIGDKISKGKLIGTLLVAMLLSPCLEIEGYFLLAGAGGAAFVLLIAVLYTIITVAGMMIWVRIAYRGLLKWNWHRLEHHSGSITGGALILTGILTFFIS